MTSYHKSRYEQAKSRRKKGKRLLVIFLVVLIVGVGTGVGMNLLFGKPPAQEKKTTTKESSESQADDQETDKDSTKRKSSELEFNLSQAMSHIYALSEQIGERPAGSVRASLAADYIVQKLGEYGYTVEEQPFTMPDGFASRNIAGSRRGTREGYTIILGAHYDSASGSQGAIDNASGVGVVLELARVFSNERLEPTLQFVFFGANRPGAGDIDERLDGSCRYVDMLGSMEKREVVGMIAIDSVAVGESFALRTQEKGLQRLKTKLDTYARENDIPTVMPKATSDSDNIPFEDAEMPAVWIQWCDSGGKLITDNKYNSVVAGKVGQAGELIESFLLDLTSDDLEELKY